ncbi:MAG: hypothetical protein P3A32_02705 [Gemmatimonadota bacterium]|jgi:hypothetical protein|nr:hypothetical protein [Gemmatimonadota bacterium]MDQ8146997.1 hypothetical protein [Gemmatimonadota bacterium]MDQ8148720.1 hypothetical protein [Gemmatimonadota bacterium]MDQ8176412.1 hypothetical protein [Gemmatimonadota bacterium]
MRSLLPIALLLTACQTTRSTSTTITGTPELRPASAPAGATVATASPAAPVVQPAGKWLVTLSAQGSPMDVQVELIRLDDGSWTGTVTSAAFPPFPVSKAVLTGNKMVATLAIPTGDTATMTLEFDGDTVTGEWAMPGDGSRLSGKRR